MIKLESIKLGYSVRAGTKEDVFFHDTYFDIYMDSKGMIHIRSKKSDEWTHVFQTNVAWFKSAEMDVELKSLGGATMKKNFPKGKTAQAQQAVI